MNRIADDSCHAVHVGLVDADLLDNGTRHPNLALLKIAGFLKDNAVSFELITDSNADISRFDHIYMSKVFTFTREPSFYIRSKEEERHKFHIGGTGYYATENKTAIFREKRTDDMTRLERDAFLNLFPNKRGGTNKMGINMEHQMPYYDLYNDYIEKKLRNGARKERYKDYLFYSIGFLTRKCYRHCPFCVNRLENGVVEYSKLEWFYDKSRPHVYFWDDNFLAAPYEIWKPLLQNLIDKNISFQFRQGLDERQFAESDHGEEMSYMLSKARYHGDYIFAFDNWKDREIIEKSLKIWKKYNASKTTKFYLFCGFKQNQKKIDQFYKDIWELFNRIRILMIYGCLGYVMRHEDYHKSPIPNLYVQVARWCNQPAFFKKMSFWEFCYRNQTYWEQKTLGKGDCNRLNTYEEFENEIMEGYYDNTKMCLPLRTVYNVINMFPEHKDELIIMFNYKMSELIDEATWKV